MILAIEDIFHALSRGEMTFDDAEKYVRAHIDLANDRDNMRDLFAGLSMQELLHQEDLGPHFVDVRKTALAKQAYIMADAMLRERAK